jgi:Skp family chaperone for outer membrane proteins
MRFDSSSPTLCSRGPRLLVLGLFALLFAACSTIKLGYNNADTLLLHALDRYVTLTDEQEHMVRQRVGSLMAGHRATQLADYAAFIQHTRSRLDDGVTQAEVTAFTEGLNTRLATLGERAAPDAAALALTLTPSQVDEVERKLIDENTKARKDSARELKQAVDQRAKKYAERSEFWLGKLNEQQMQLVRASLANRPVDSLYWLEARERRTRDLVALLRRIQAERPSEQAAAAWFRAYFRELAQPSNPGQRARAEAFRRDNAELVAQLVNSASPQQRAHLDRKLSGFAAEFVQLAAARGGTG